MSASRNVPGSLPNIMHLLALLGSCDFAGDSMTYIDHYSMSIDCICLLLFLALALLNIAVSNSGFI